MADPVQRAPGCVCHWEEGDSPCPVHGDEGDDGRSVRQSMLLATGHLTAGQFVDQRPDWVSQRLGRPLDEGERALVYLVCDALRTGPWNLKWTSLRGGPGVASVAVDDSRLATWDFDGLTRLVVLAHDRGLRVSVESAGLKVRITARPALSQPTMERAIASIRSGDRG